MSAPEKCPRCDSPVEAGTCLRCVFADALAGVTTSAETAASATGVPEHYQLVEELGRGATATVWLAHDRKLDRLVALKLIPAAADRRLVQRLVREGQSVARLRHPNIVAVHALSASDHAAYLAMDYVEGGDLRQRLAQGVPEPRVAAEWIRKIASALSHAHANNVLHRDIKPSNILLDAAGDPHLADFGLAAPLEGAGDLTLPGQVAGTAAYLPPEILGGAERASPASDLYSLGAVLYECLTGRAPFVGETSAAIMAQITDLDPPAPRLLRPEIPRDLETIGLKCLEKLPVRRYGSAEALEQDLGRFLRGEPIAARPIGRAEKVIRWCRRRPATAAVTGLAAALLLGLAIGGPLVALRLARANARAEAAAATSAAVTDFLQRDLLAQAAPEAQPDRDLKLRTVLDRAAKNVEGRFDRQPLVEADVRETLASTYFSLGEYGAAREHWEQTRNLRSKELGPDHPKTLRAGSQLFDSLRATGKLADAETLALDVIARQRRVLGSAHADTLASLSHLAVVYRLQGKLAAAEALYKEALEVHRRTVGSEDSATLTVMNNLAVVYRNQGRNAEAADLHSEILATRMRRLGPEHPDTLHSMNNLVLAYKAQGKLAEAEPLSVRVTETRRRVLGVDHPHTLVSLITLATLFHDQGKFADAEDRYRHTLELQQRKLGPEHPEVLTTLSNLGTVLRDQAKLAEAEAILVRVVEIRTRALGREHLQTGNSIGHLARLRRDQGRHDEALRLLLEELPLIEKSLGPSSPLTLLFLDLLGDVLHDLNRFVEAENYLRRAVDARTKIAPADWQTASSRSKLGGALLAQHRHDEAAVLLVPAHAILTEQANRIPAMRRREVGESAQRLERLRAEQSRAAQR
jgi:eukaryotic-like serine/threonine-protein kinase